MAHHDAFSPRGVRTEPPRREYRLFFLGRDDRILGRFDLRRAINDKTAIREARDLRYPGICELWDGTRRLVQRFESNAD